MTPLAQKAGASKGGRKPLGGGPSTPAASGNSLFSVGEAGGWSMSPKTILLFLKTSSLFFVKTAPQLSSHSFPIDNSEEALSIIWFGSPLTHLTNRQHIKGQTRHLVRGISHAGSGAPPTSRGGRAAVAPSRRAQPRRPERGRARQRTRGGGGASSDSGTPGDSSAARTCRPRPSSRRTSCVG
mgnify:CR=1 FL=1